MFSMLVDRLRGSSKWRLLTRSARTSDSLRCLGGDGGGRGEGYNGAIEASMEPVLRRAG